LECGWETSDGRAGPTAFPAARSERPARRSRQAVEPKVALDPVVEMHGPDRSARAQLAQHRRGDLQQPIGGGVRPRLLAQHEITGGHEIAIMMIRSSVASIFCAVASLYFRSR
jgi:hypothetical protein